MFAKIIKSTSLVLFTLTFMACSLFIPAATPSAAEIEKEEQAVYSVFMKEGVDPMLILQMTSTNLADQEPKQIRDHIRGSFEDVSNDTVQSYLDRNAQPGELSPDMDMGVDYVLLNADELKKITRQPNWRQVLMETYPGSNGYLIFSRVGFNRSLDQAVIYVGDVGGPLMGAGYYYLLEKQDGQWSIKEEVMVWIS